MAEGGDAVPGARGGGWERGCGREAVQRRGGAEPGLAVPGNAEWHVSCLQLLVTICL